MADVIHLDICVRQGAQFREEYQRINRRYVFEAQGRGTSGASTPTFPTALDSTVVDNDITWLNLGRFSAEQHPAVKVWLASTAYARRSQVLTPIDPVDLAGYTGAFQLRPTISSDTVIYSGTVSFGTRANGEFNMVIPTADTDDFDFDEAVYDLELVTSADEVDLVMRGRVALIKEVTRS